MSENIQRNRGRSKNYKFDRGGNPTEFGPFIGEVKNNVDNVRSGRLQVYIEQFGGDNPEDESLWRTVNYIPPFYGSILQNGTDKGTGTFVGNPQSYGMWFTPPDIGTQVICFFVAGDPNQGYYMGCIPDPGITHMIPAIGASKKFDTQNAEQKEYFKNAKQLPVTEINSENDEIDNNPQFFNQPKPVHSYLAGVMLQQGVINDTERGPITSNSQRESPSAVFGISTPGRPVFQGGDNDKQIKKTVENKDSKLESVKVVARRGGHSLVMDDGDLEGLDNLVRIRSSKGHQITMSDDGNFFYILHANGQTWVELGAEGTIDLFSTNSVNVRSQGEINLHADKNINMYAGESINIKSKTVRINSVESLDLASKTNISMYSESSIGVTASGSLGIKSQSGNWDGGSSLALKGGTINLNGPGAGSASIPKPALLEDIQLPDVAWVEGKGWEEEKGKLITIVSRAPTHEPYPYHNRGVEAKSTVTQFTASGGASGDSSGFVGTPSTASVIPPTPTTVATAGLTNLPVTQAVTPAQILKQTAATTGIGSLNVPQVTSLLSSAAAGVGQAANAFSALKGIGQYGFSPLQLEQLGLIKPGTIRKYLGNSNTLNAVLTSPTIWTGKDGVSNLGGILTNSQLQTRLQQGLMKDGLTALRKTGVLNGLETVPQLGSLLQSTAKYGPENVKLWAAGQANAFVQNQINKISKNAQVAIKVATSIVGAVFGGSSARGPIAIAGIVGTVNRLPVTNAIAGVIGDKKVPVPDYTVTSIDIRQQQREVRTEAFNKAIAEGKSEREAAALGAAAGNNWGEAELAKFGTGTGTAGSTTTAGTAGTTGRTNSLQEFQQTFGTQTAQSAGQSTFLGTGSGLPVSGAGSNADAALAQTRGTTNVNYADSQFQSQAQIDAEIAQEAKLAANKNALGRQV
jgi:hypothetical protein